MALKKYMFLEDFQIAEGKEAVDSSRFFSTRKFGGRYLHQIVECIYHESTKDGEKIVTVVQGKKGGWIERYGNLSQTGDCWVEQGAIVCGNAVVSEDAIIKGNAEVGDRAKVRGKSEITDNATIGEGAVIDGYSNISGESEIKGFAFIESAWISGKTKIEGDVRIICPITFSNEEDQEKFEGMSSQEQRLKTIEISDSEIDENVYITGGQTYITESKLTGNVVIGGESYITKKAEIGGNCNITRSVVAGPIEIEDVITDNGCIGVVKNISKAWDERADRGVIPYSEQKPSSITIAEIFVG